MKKSDKLYILSVIPPACGILITLTIFFVVLFVEPTDYKIFVWDGALTDVMKPYMLIVGVFIVINAVVVFYKKNLYGVGRNVAYNLLGAYCLKYISNTLVM